MLEEIWPRGPSTCIGLWIHDKSLEEETDGGEDLCTTTGGLS